MPIGSEPDHDAMTGTCNSRWRAPDDAADDELALHHTVEKIVCGYIRDDGDDLSMRQLAVLLQLARAPMDVTPLAQHLGLPVSTISRAIDALAKQQLAKRTRNGRYVTATITPQGCAKIGRLLSSARIA